MIISPLFSLEFIWQKFTHICYIFHSFVLGSHISQIGDFYILRIWRTILQYLFICHIIQDLESTLVMIKQINIKYSYFVPP